MPCTILMCHVEYTTFLYLTRHVKKSPYFTLYSTVSCLSAHYQDDRLIWKLCLNIRFGCDAGEDVPSDEQASAKEVAGDALVSSTSMTSLPQLAATGGGAPMNEEEAIRWQMEKQGLCQQLDEKVRVDKVKLLSIYLLLRKPKVVWL